MIRAAPSALTRVQRAVVWICWLGGGLLRLVYVLVLHPATAHIYSDMGGYVDRALFAFGGRPQGIADTLYPPAASMLFGALHILDPSWQLCVIVQWLMSLGVMGLVWLIARHLYGTSAAVVALVITTLYPPLIHYAGLFLAENPFTFFMLLAMWLSLLAIDARGWIGTSILGLLAGFTVALAAAFKATVLQPFLITGIVYLVFALRHRRLCLPALAASMLLGSAVLFVPLSLRCTRLSEGHFCLVSNNIAMNVLMGHDDGKLSFFWHDRTRNLEFSFTSPGASLRGDAGRVDLDFGPYDSEANMQLAWQWIAQHPGKALRLSVQNVVELFTARTLWPFANLRGVDIGVWSQRMFWWAILLPASLWLLVRARAMLSLRADSLPEWLLIAPVLGLCATVFMSITEVRFRVPFDGLLIVLASQGWVATVRRIRSLLRD